MATPETELKDAVVEYLKATGAFFRRMHSGKVRVRRGYVMLGPEGTGDFLVFKGIVPHWLELKAKGLVTGKARKAAQAAFAAEVTALGHHYAICESVDDVVKALEA